MISFIASSLTISIGTGSCLLAGRGDVENIHVLSDAVPNLSAVRSLPLFWEIHPSSNSAVELAILNHGIEYSPDWAADNDRTLLTHWGDNISILTEVSEHTFATLLGASNAFVGRSHSGNIRVVLPFSGWPSETRIPVEPDFRSWSDKNIPFLEAGSAQVVFDYPGVK